MKGFLVVNQLNDPFYIEYDTDFATYVILRAKEKGLLEHDSTITKLDANLVMQIFSPLVCSQWLLADQREPCSTIICPNGYLFVFKQMDDLLFLTINGDGDESEAFLQRKLEVFITLMKFIFGPVAEEMGQSHFYSRKAKWEFLREIMRSWQDMVESEQAFLVEAIERLHVNQMVSEKCIEILERTVKQVQASKEQVINHAILLVNSKLLGLYSNRSAHELRSKDILALTILAKTIYPHSEKLEDLFSVHYSGPKSKASEDDYSDGGEDEYHSAPNTPGGQRSRSPPITIDSNYYNSLAATSSRTKSFSSAQQRDSLSQLSDTLKNSDDRLDHETSVQLEYSDTGLTLLDMYSEKYPDSAFKNIKSEVDSKTSISSNSEQKHQSFEVCAEVYDHQDLKKLAQDAKNHSNVTQNQAESVGHLQHHGSSKEFGAEVPNGLPAGDEPIKTDSENCKDADNGTSHSANGSKTLEYQYDKDYGKLDNCANQSSAPSSGRSSEVSGGKTSRASTISFEPNNETYTPSRTSSVLSNMSKSYPELSPNDGQGFKFNELEQNLLQEDVTDNHTERNKRISMNVTPPKRRTQAPTPSQLGETMKSSFNTYWPQSVFLETAACPYVPYNIHCLQVSPGVTLLLLSQVQKHILAEYIFQVISNIQDLIYNKRSKFSRTRSNQVYEIINSLLSKLHSNLKKNKGRVSALSRDLHSRWEKDELKHKLIDYLEKDQKFPISSELESQLSEIYKKLKELFSHLFLSPVQYPTQLIETLAQIKLGVSKDLIDYREYLNVKAQRNITMTSYIDEFPGLIHFIFVDRLFHQMSAPSLNISLNSGDSVDATSFLKEKIWTMYQHVMCRLTEGYTTVLLREGDFYFSYFLWFEDYMGNPLPVQESFKPSSKFSYPGILSGSFYRLLQLHCFPHAMQNSVHCFEMFLVHLGTVHPEYISAHCKRLAHKMWEMTGEAYNSVSLL